MKDTESESGLVIEQTFVDAASALPNDQWKRLLGALREHSIQTISVTANELVFPVTRKSSLIQDLCQALALNKSITTLILPTLEYDGDLWVYMLHNVRHVAKLILFKRITHHGDEIIRFFQLSSSLFQHWHPSRK